jgi:G3E family GTPase
VQYGKIPAMSTRPSTDKIPLTVLTGFLGAGKTTILGHLIRQPEMANAAVIINEFGEISLDHELVEKTDGDVIEIKGGCLCCTVRGDLIETLHGLLLKQADGKIKAFDRVIVETTGLADPAPILHTLMSDPMAFTKFRLDGVVTAVDAVNGLSTLNQHDEALKQAAVADLVLLTKLDLAGGTQRAALEQRLEQINPGLRLLGVEQGRIDASQILDLGPFDPKAKSADVERWLNAEAYAGHTHDHDHDHRHEHHYHAHHDHTENPPDITRHNAHIRSYSFTLEKPMTLMRLQFFLQLLGMLRGPDLLRVKGIMHVADRPDQPAVIHGVQHIFHPLTWLATWPSESRTSRLVFIVRDIDRDHIQDLINSLAV